jgi:hypothetical protein
MSEICIYNKCRKKNIGKANKKTTDKNFLPPLCIKKNKQFSQKKEENERRNYFINNTHTKTTTTTTRTRRATLNNGIIIK